MSISILGWDTFLKAKQNSMFSGQGLTSGFRTGNLSKIRLENLISHNYRNINFDFCPFF